MWWKRGISRAAQICSFMADLSRVGIWQKEVVIFGIFLERNCRGVWGKDGGAVGEGG